MCPAGPQTSHDHSRMNGERCSFCVARFVYVDSGCKIRSGLKYPTAYSPRRVNIKIPTMTIPKKIKAFQQARFVYVVFSLLFSNFVLCMALYCWQMIHAHRLHPLALDDQCMHARNHKIRFFPITDLSLMLCLQRLRLHDCCGSGGACEAAT